MRGEADLRIAQASAVALLCLAACHRSSQLSNTALLVASPSELAFAPVSPGATAHAVFTVRNAGANLEQVTVSTSAPFSVAPLTASLAPGAQVTFDAAFAPVTRGAFSQQIHVEGLRSSGVVDAKGWTPCPGADACHTVVQDPSTGACTQVPAPNGSACGDGCLTGATCFDGRCVGAPRSCDDDNACTVDACDSSGGCIHAPRSCPADACHAATCDPQTGCGLAPLADGSPCGTGDCSNIHICLAGTCVARPNPDGSPCGSPSPCQPAGVCQAGTCARNPRSTLQPLWTYAVASGAYLWSPLMADDASNLYWLECHQQPACEVVSFTEAGVARLRAPTPDVFDPGEPVLLSQGLLIAGANSTLDAVRTSNGQLAWRHDFVSELVASGPPCPFPRPYLTSLADDGHGGLLAQFQSEDCGAGAWNGSWTVGLDTNTGTTRWVQPRLGSWLVSCDAYGTGTVVSDEAGHAYVFDGLNPCPGSDLVPALSAFAQDGTARWLDAMSRSNWSRPAAVFGGNLCNADGTLLDANDGAHVASIPLPTGYWGVEALLSSRGGYVFQGTIGSSRLNLTRFDAQGSLTWMQQFSATPDSGRDIELGNTPTLTSTDSVLFATGPGAGTQPANATLFDIDADGGRTFECPLPAANFEYYGASVLLPDGKWVALHWGPWFQVEAFDLAPLAPAATGWINPGGSAAHANRPR